MIVELIGLALLVAGDIALTSYWGGRISGKVDGLDGRLKRVEGWIDARTADRDRDR